MLFPEAVVQRQLDAYNARNLDRLVEAYAPNAELFEHPATLLARGADEIRQRYAARLQEPNLHAKLLKRVVLGSTVIDHEVVTRTFPEGSGTLELMMIYEVVGERIAKAWAIAGPRQLDPKS